MGNKSVIELLDEIKNSVDSLASTNNESPNPVNLSNKPELISFIKKSDKLISYSGPKKKFFNAKIFSIILDFLFFFFSVCATAFCAISYEKFVFFPAIQTFLAVPIFVMLISILRTKRVNTSLKLSKFSLFRYKINKSGLHIKTKKIKIFYLMWLIIFCSTCIFCMTHVMLKRQMYIPDVFVAEIILFVTLFASLSLKLSFYKKFTVVLYRIIDEVTNENITIVQDMKTNKMYPLSDYIKEFPDSILTNYENY